MFIAELTDTEGKLMDFTWDTLTAAELGRQIAAGRIDPVDLCDFFLERIDASPLAPRIYARIMPERARPEAEAARARARAGLRIGPLDGVPVSWKDLFDTAGVATEAGSALLAGRTPAQDAPVVRTATRAGLVALGKTHMSELAFSGLGLNPVMGTPPNINDPKAVPGGSSSGAGASVAFGLAPLAIGSDTGGSVRIPSAWNDLVGLKTTHGLIATQGAVPLCENFDTIGPLARSVEDCALALSALTAGPQIDLQGVSLQGRKIAVLETLALDALRPEPARAFDAALSRLTAAGASVTRITFPAIHEAMALAGILFTAEAWAIWGETIETAPQKMFPRILERFRGGIGIEASAYIRAWRRLHEIRAAWAEAVAGFDAVALPTSPILPPDAERLLHDSDYYVTENLLALRNTRIGNLMDSCGLTLPTGVPSCGLLLMGKPRQEAGLLRLGLAAERALT